MLIIFYNTIIFKTNNVNNNILLYIKYFEVEPKINHEN